MQVKFSLIFVSALFNLNSVCPLYVEIKSAENNKTYNTENSESYDQLISYLQSNENTEHQEYYENLKILDELPCCSDGALIAPEWFIGSYSVISDAMARKRVFDIEYGQFIPNRAFKHPQLDLAIVWTINPIWKTKPINLYSGESFQKEELFVYSDELNNRSGVEYTYKGPPEKKMGLYGQCKFERTIRENYHVMKFDHGDLGIKVTTHKPDSGCPIFIRTHNSGDRWKDFELFGFNSPGGAVLGVTSLDKGLKFWVINTIIADALDQVEPNATSSASPDSKKL